MTQLEKDYLAMVASAMFYDTPPSFEAVIRRLRTLQDQVNEAMVNT